MDVHEIVVTVERFEQRRDEENIAKISNNSSTHDDQDGDIDDNSDHPPLP